MVDGYSTGVGLAITVNGEALTGSLLDCDAFRTIVHKSDSLAVLDSRECFREGFVALIADLGDS